MIRFADGEGDVLLATNIVESGLDVPNANTMLVWRPDRFGQAQLHQLRGRVGRSRVRGVCLLLSAPITSSLPRRAGGWRRSRRSTGRARASRSARRIWTSAARATCLARTRAGMSGWSARTSRITCSTGRWLARGETIPPEWTPEVNLGCEATIPAAYIPEPEVRLNLYHRIARAASAREVVALAEEIADRFGGRPPELDRLLVLARLAVACRLRGVERLDGGPQALAMSFHESARRPEPIPALDPPRPGATIGWSGRKPARRMPSGCEPRPNCSRRSRVVTEARRFRVKSSGTPAGRSWLPPQAGPRRCR